MSIHFSYSDKEGLNLTGFQGRVIIKNILGQVLALKDGDADGIIRLIEKAGFILPISFQNYEAIELNALMKIIRRIKATVKLMERHYTWQQYRCIEAF